MNRWSKSVLAALMLGACQPATAAVWYDSAGNGVDANGIYTQNPGGIAVPVSPSAPMPVSSSPGARTIVPLDVATVTTGGTAVTALNAGHATAGGFLVTSNAAGICVSQAGTAGTATSGSTQCVAANQRYNLVPSANAVSVNSTASAVAVGGEGLQ